LVGNHGFPFGWLSMVNLVQGMRDLFMSLDACSLGELRMIAVDGH
jgi:hypothetical protein